MTGRLSVAARITEATSVPAASRRVADPCVVIIFGAAGDLTRRKLMPALLHLMTDGLLGEQFAIVGVDRSALDDDTFRSRVRSGLAEFAEDGGPDPAAWERFSGRLSVVSGDFADAQTYANIGRRLAALGTSLPAQSGHLFYLAVPPSVTPTIITQLAASGIAPRVPDANERPWTRIVLEKPFGHSLESALALNTIVRRAFAEHQVYRIDHYLGKETVQNLLVFRFANSIFEPVWNRQHIHHVQITAAESVGVEHRARYYEEAGVVRDMFQNHLLQLLTLTALEPPVTFSADAVRDEKVKVLRAVRPITPAEMHDYSVRGQYGPGTIDAPPVLGYRARARRASRLRSNT